MPEPEAYKRGPVREKVRILTREDVLAQLKSISLSPDKIRNALERYDSGTFRPVEATVVIDFTLPDAGAVVTERRSVCEVRKQHPSEEISLDLVIIDGLMLDMDLAKKFGKRM